MFSILHSRVTRMSSGSKRKSKPCLIVALRIARSGELKASSLFCMYLALIFTCEKLVGLISRNSPIQCKASFHVCSTFLAIRSATMRLRNDFRLLPLDILVTRECMIKHFSSSHNTAKQGRFLSRMKHQTFDKTLKLTEVFTSCHIYGLLFYGRRDPRMN